MRGRRGLTCAVHAEPVEAPVAQIPAAVKQLPSQLKGDEGFARAGRQRQQDAIALGQRRQHTRSMAMS